MMKSTKSEYLMRCLDFVFIFRIYN